jgi:hypothetical protein
METREIARSPKHRKTSRKYWVNDSLLGDKLKEQNRKQYEGGKTVEIYGSR